MSLNTSSFFDTTNANQEKNPLHNSQIQNIPSSFSPLVNIKKNLFYSSNYEISFEELRAKTLGLLPLGKDEKDQVIVHNNNYDDDDIMKTIFTGKEIEKSKENSNKKIIVTKQSLEFNKMSSSDIKSKEIIGTIIPSTTKTKINNNLELSDMMEIISSCQYNNYNHNHENGSPSVSAASTFHHYCHQSTTTVATKIIMDEKDIKCNKNYNNKYFNLITSPSLKNFNEKKVNTNKLLLFPIPSNPCKPLNQNLIEKILNSLNNFLNDYPEYHDLRNQNSNQHEKILRILRQNKPQSRHAINNINDNTTTTGCYSSEIDDNSIQILDKTFIVCNKIGEGSYGKVYRVLDKKKFIESGININNKKNNNVNASIALKIQIPPSSWEFYIIKQLHQRLLSTTAAVTTVNSIIKVFSLCYYKNESYLLTEYCNHGSLLDLINNLKKDNSQIDEILVIFFTIELLKVIESIHKVGIIHCDIKVDNCLLRLESLSSEDNNNSNKWDSQYNPFGENGWSKKGIKLIDFGRSIDVTLFPPNMKFIADWKTDEEDCVEMREGRPWKWQADYYGLAGVIYCMLHNEYLQVTQTHINNDGYDCNIDNSNMDLWKRLFDILLNSSSLLRSIDNDDGDLLLELKEIRKEFENYLVENCEKSGKSLKSLLKKLEVKANT
ncbi:1944_t:CDS:2 [Entrophospora sp. SA101]|nr:1944_t:CDS:2 [Entrophospora sp. SA101]